MTDHAKNLREIAHNGANAYDLKVFAAADHIEQLEAQLAAVGAGGVEPLRRATVTAGVPSPMRVYIAGPMTGYEDFNFPAFNSAAEALRKKGFDVQSPAEHGIVDGAVWADYLRYDIGVLVSCGKIHLLPGWSTSKGALLEKHIAETLGLKVTFADGAELPKSLHPDTLQAIAEWFTKAFPVVTDQSRVVQFGCNLEEVAEGIEAVGGHTWAIPVHELADLYKADAEEILAHDLAHMTDSQRADLLDALGDQIVTAVGVAYMMGFDIIGALQAINTANYDKFVEGQPIYKPNGKLDKRPGWEAPNLATFSKRK